jgi:hypothetical protein
MLLEPLDIPEDTEVLVTPLLEKADFYLKVSESSLGKIWDNKEDDVYAALA